MSKPVKQLMRKELTARLQGVTSLAVVGFTGIDAVTLGRIRAALRDKQVSLTVVHNSVAKTAFENVGIPQAKDLLDGPCALAYGADSVVTVVRELLELRKEAENLQVKGALLEGQVFGPDRVEQLSKYPTRDEAIANVAAAILAPARKIAGCLVGPASKIAGALKTIQDKQGGQAEAA